MTLLISDQGAASSNDSLVCNGTAVLVFTSFSMIYQSDLHMSQLVACLDMFYDAQFSA